MAPGAVDGSIRTLCDDVRNEILRKFHPSYEFQFFGLFASATSFQFV